jgi:hypothetical protein
MRAPRSCEVLPDILIDLRLHQLEVGARNDVCGCIAGSCHPLGELVDIGGKCEGVGANDGVVGVVELWWRGSGHSEEYWVGGEGRGADLVEGDGRVLDWGVGEVGIVDVKCLCRAGKRTVIDGLRVLFDEE